MSKSPPANHYEQCTGCRGTFPPDQLTAASEVIPGRKRGWVCDACILPLTRLVAS
jgi:hypothetical protein